MAKKLVLCFDGTWNTPDHDGDIGGDHNTNDRKMYEAVLAQDDGGIPQQAWYQPGIGHKWYNRIRGGLFGCGLSANIREGYEYLIKHYEDGDQVFLFGFSRGAYIARSLVGLIRNCGLLYPRHKNMVRDAYALYRTRGDGADSENARYFRERYSRLIDIEFLGVWDTVGALGIPVGSFEWFNRSFYEFHDTELSGIVRHAYHAIAIDEHREPYVATLWDPKAKPNQVMEQVWFPGAHADVGGGYPERELADITLQWMMGKAAACGLALDLQRIPAVEDRHYLAPLHDSFRLFLGGVYSQFANRHFRDIGRTLFGAECFHESVRRRCEALIDYKPKNPIWEFVADIPEIFSTRVIRLSSK